MKHDRDEMASVAYRLFGQGKDTLDIARELHITESRASRLVWVGRCRAKGLAARFLNTAGELREVAGPIVVQQRV